MVLLNGPVVVQQSCFGARHDVETVGRSSMFEIVDNGRQNSSENLQIRQPVLLFKIKSII